MRKKPKRFNLFRGDIMKMKGIVTGMGIGAAVGSATAATAAIMSNSSLKRQYKKKANKAMKTMHNLIGDIQYMFK